MLQNSYKKFEKNCGYFIPFAHAQFAESYKLRKHTQFETTNRDSNPPIVETGLKSLSTTINPKLLDKFKESLKGIKDTQVPEEETKSKQTRSKYLFNTNYKAKAIRWLRNFLFPVLHKQIHLLALQIPFTKLIRNGVSTILVVATFIVPVAHIRIESDLPLKYQYSIGAISKEQPNSEDKIVQSFIRKTVKDYRVNNVPYSIFQQLMTLLKKNGLTAGT